MPEATGILVRRSEVGGRLWVRRVDPPAAAVTTRRMSRATEDNKENIPPAGYLESSPLWRRRRVRVRKSPLPEWYPRTPLRDITAIVNALEKRRQQVQVARAAEGNRNGEASQESPQELSVADQTLPIDSTPLHVTTCIPPSSPVEHPLKTPSTSSSISEIDTSPSNEKRTEAEEKLCKSIDQIEKIVKKNELKRSVRREVTAKREVMQRKTLMSMR
ncbi:protein POLYCHOME-like [Asparagus officinalis]|nr:protein POLYCHOME-like [Asparagus officinalis]